MKLTRWLKSWEFSLAVMLVVEVLVLGAINPAFLKVEDLLYSTNDFMHIIFAALAMTLTIITGGIDISSTSVMGLTSIVIGLGWVAGMNIVAAVALAIVVGTLAGLFNGLFVAYTDIHPLVITLGTLFMFGGIAAGLPGVLDFLGFKAYGAAGFSAYMYEGITGFPQSFGDFTQNSIMGLPIPLILIFLFALFLALLLHRTRFGRYLYLIGVNQEAAEYTGVPVKKALILAYTLSGLGAAIAGVMLTSYFTSARSDLGSKDLLPIITAVVLGGTDIMGGSGTIVGTLIAGIFIGYLRQGLLALGVTSDVVPVVTGFLLVVVVAAKLLVARFNEERLNRQALKSRQEEALGGLGKEVS